MYEGEISSVNAKKSGASGTCSISVTDLKSKSRPSRTSISISQRLSTEEGHAKLAEDEGKSDEREGEIRSKKNLLTKGSVLKKARPTSETEEGIAGNLLFGHDGADKWLKQRQSRISTTTNRRKRDQ